MKLYKGKIEVEVRKSWMINLLRKVGFRIKVSELGELI